MRDIHPYINDALVVRHLRDIALIFEQSIHSLVMLSPHMQLPPDLEKLVVLLIGRCQTLKSFRQSLTGLCKTWMIRRSCG